MAMKSRGYSFYTRSDTGKTTLRYRDAEGNWRGQLVPPGLDKDLFAKNWIEENVSKVLAERQSKSVDTVGNFFLSVLEEEKGNPNIKKTTWNAKKSRLDVHIYPFFKDMKWEDVKAGVIKDFVRVVRGKVAPSTCRNIMIHLSSLFISAVEAEKIGVNPMNFAGVQAEIPHPKNDSQKPVIALSLLEARDIVGYSVEPWKFRIILALLTGMRDGEIAALQWRNVRLDDEIPHIEVVRTFAQTGDFFTPKTVNSRRNIPLPPQLVEELKARRGGDDEYLFTKIRGSGPFRPTSALYLRRAAKSAKVEKNINFHTLRKSYSTWLALAGVNDNIRGKLLGHAPQTLTEAVYTSRELKELWGAVKKLPQLLVIGKVVKKKN